MAHIVTEMTQTENVFFLFRLRLFFFQPRQTHPRSCATCPFLLAAGETLLHSTPTLAAIRISSCKSVFIHLWNSFESPCGKAKSRTNQSQKLQPDSSFDSFSYWYSGLHAERINSQKWTEYLHNLAVRNNKLEFFSRRSSWYVYSSGP